MAISAATVFEVRTTGSDNNGGGFVAGASGTDRSQQDAAFASGTNLTVDATTNTDVTPDGYSPVAADVGNIIQIRAGTGFTVGPYEIRSIQAGKWRLDRSPAATSTTGGTWALGGAFASPGKAAGAAVGSNTIWIKSGTYTISSPTGNVSGGKLALALTGTISAPTKICGYGAVRGDGGSRPVLQVASSGVTGISVVATGASIYVHIENIEVDGQSKASIKGIDLSGTSFVRAYRCKASNCTNEGIQGTGSSAELIACEATGISGGTAAIELSGGGTAVGCIARANTVNGFFAYQGEVYGCLSYGNTGRGFWSGGGVRPVFIGCTAYGNTGNGFDTETNAGRALIANCLSYGNGGRGFASNEATCQTLLLNCAGGNNTSGDYDAAKFLNVVGFVTLTADPFISAGTGNLGLNTTAAGGAAARAAGFPGVFPGGLTTGYVDIGAAQHADPGGLLTGSGMTGGMRG